MQPEEFSKEMWGSLREASASYNTFAKRMGVDTSELSVVDALWDAPEGLTQKAIGEMCDMGKQTISAICKRLAARNHLAACPSTNDKRERIMTLTDEGRAWWGDTVKRMREIESDAAKAISSEDAEIFLRVAKRYVEILQQEMC